MSVMLLKEVEAKLTAVLKSLSDTPRSSYEVENLYRLNCERVESAQAVLSDMSGDYVEQLRARCSEAQKQAEAKHAAGVAGTAAIDNAFTLDFEMDDGAEEIAAELAEAKLAAGVNRRPTKKSSAKTKSKKSKNSETSNPPAPEQLSTGSSVPPATQPTSGAAAESKAVAPPAVVGPAWTVLERQEDLASSQLPRALATSGRGTCEPVSNSPLARLFFTEDMEWDDTVCHCAVEMYRCVAIALSYGEPLMSWAECQKVAQAQRAAGLSHGKGLTSKGASGVSSVAGPAPSSVTPQATEGAKNAEDEAAGEEEEEEDSEEDLTLSEQLIADYEQAQLAEQKEDLDTSVLPRDVCEKLQQRLRGFTDEVWVVLLCHGGYFAGGVFVQGKCVVHKAFQRYVVRKKQGGKQSSNADGGSFNSVGAMIRTAQEIKWRIDVRDILLEWTPYINAASFILYAAPGPQNRAMLTDFSLVPAAAAVNGTKGVSPIVLKDRRVSRVPITTRRPNFEEVKRIYNVCSHCSLLYVKEGAEGQ